MEPALAAVLVAVAFLNGLVLTFEGTWAGEMLQRTDVDDEAPALS